MTATNDLIQRVITPRGRDIGGFEVRRVLPVAGCRHVGPFVFLDHMGPAEFGIGKGIDVRPHPHIGLATVTYLYEGEILHRDSLGYVQPIRPGDVNWMTAGSGIVHSERTAEERRVAPHKLHGMQAWVALPLAAEEGAASFVHHPNATLPQKKQDGAALTVIAGEAYGLRSPVLCASPLFYVDAILDAGANLDVTDEYPERGFYVSQGGIEFAGQDFKEGDFVLVASPSAQRGSAAIKAKTAARVMLLGGAPLDAERFIFWNFVSSSKARIEQAKQDWREGRFGKVPGETEFIPLPEE